MASANFPPSFTHGEDEEADVRRGHEVGFSLRSLGAGAEVDGCRISIFIHNGGGAPTVLDFAIILFYFGVLGFLVKFS